MPKFCPQCTNVQLKIADRKGVEIDYCPDCGGIWLDSGELNKIIDQYVSKQTRSFESKPIVKSSHSKIKTASSVVDTVFDMFEFFSDE